ncbi:Phytoene desaturase-like protein [Hapsidospora chrysogenum ATCC 11550]|uniref:Phytoene desaturase n=1 Tax=Hapsidospora chrysogenum (strain ATCC 11550 / CBS 779.69 / DSM 880 / IAM 14645 / JCM 23072 / IMI 49137) TaxID=857340 RepID=A0A086T077_HAPC1|nr:Phytoene desaturase-like protein [Hapsidospora chrysogenum ATCC 11550]
MSEKSKSAIIVGAGAGGVALAARLAKAGLRVTVVEKNDHTGGRCSLIHHEGHRFDQGPSLFLLPRLFHQTFEDLGTTLPAAGVDLLRCQTNYNVYFHDGERFQHSSDLAAMRTEMERWEGAGGFERWVAWLREGHRHYEISVREVLGKNFVHFWDMVRPSFVATILDMHPFESMWSRAGRYFYTERLRRVFTFATMYMGMSPFDAPATYSLLQYTEFAEGIWYPKGGFHKVVDALVRIGQSFGVEYRLSTPVARVLTSPDGKKATGVLLESGEELSADIVVLNADLVYSYGNLLPRSPAIENRTRSLQKKEASCSSISFYWSMKRKIPELSTHNIFLAEEYRESFDAIFDRHTIPDEPSFYVNVPSRVDPTAAPDGCDSVIVLVPVGHLSRRSKGATPTADDHDADAEGLLPTDEQHWDQIVDRARTAVISAIEARASCTGLREAIGHEIVNTPPTWETRFNLDRGAILGLSHNFLNVLWFRPKTRAPELGATYFVGASTHPGTGVPIVMAGTRITAEQILGDLGMAVPWSRRDEKVVQGGKVVSEVMDGRSDTWLRFGTEEFIVLVLLGTFVLFTAYLLSYVSGPGLVLS